MKGVYKKCIAGLLLSSYIVGLFVGLAPEAHATVPGWDVAQAGVLPPVITGVSVTAGLETCIGYDYTKEFAGLISLDVAKCAVLSVISSWDSIAWMFAKIAVGVIKQQTIAWIRSGFEGQPLFIQDPSKFLKDWGDQASAVFVEDLSQKLTGDPQFFCKDFLPEFVIDIGGYGNDYFFRSRCSITDVIQNLDDYYQDFENGGWDAFISINQRNNNRYSFYLMTLEEEQRRRAEAQASISGGSSGGYLPTIECVSGNTAGCRKFRIKTPAKAIGDRVAHTVGLDYNTLITADELSEVVGSLVDLAIQRTLESFL